jgi:hypothetical protein
MVNLWAYTAKKKKTVTNASSAVFRISFRNEPNLFVKYVKNNHNYNFYIEIFVIVIYG